MKKPSGEKITNVTGDILRNQSSRTEETATTTVDIPDNEKLQEVRSRRVSVSETSPREVMQTPLLEVDRIALPLEPRAFFQMHGDPYLNETGWEGESPFKVSDYLIKFFQKNRIFETFRIDLERAGEIYQKFDGLFEKSPGIVEADPKRCAIDTWKVFDKYVSEVSENLANLKDGTRMFIPGGWQNPGGGHAMLYEVKRERDSYTLTVYNTGAGIEYHEGGQVDGKVKCMAGLRISGISPEKIEDNKLIHALLETRLPFDLKGEKVQWKPEDVYMRLGLFGGKREVQDDMMTPQRSGTCSWRSLLAAVRDEFIRTAPSFKEGIRNYKQFRVKFRTQSIIDFYETNKEELSQPEGKELRLGLADALARTIRFARKQNQLGYIDEVALKEVYDTCVDLLRKVDALEEASSVGMLRSDFDLGSITSGPPLKTTWVPRPRVPDVSFVDQTPRVRPPPSLDVRSSSFVNDLEQFKNELFTSQRAGNSKQVLRWTESVIQQIPFLTLNPEAWNSITSNPEEVDRVAAILEDIVTVYHAALATEDIEKDRSVGVKPSTTFISLVILMRELQPITIDGVEGTFDSTRGLSFIFTNLVEGVRNQKLCFLDLAERKRMSEIRQTLAKLSEKKDSRLFCPSVEQNPYDDYMYLTHSFRFGSPSDDDNSYLATLYRKNPGIFDVLKKNRPDLENASIARLASELYSDPERAGMPPSVGRRLRMEALITYFRWPSNTFMKGPLDPENYRVKLIPDVEQDNAQVVFRLNGGYFSTRRERSDQKILSTLNVNILNKGYYNREKNTYRFYTFLNGIDIEDPEFNQSDRVRPPFLEEKTPIWHLSPFHAQMTSRPSLAIGFFSEPQNLPLLVDSDYRSTLYELLFEGYATLPSALELNTGLIDELDQFIKKGYENFIGEGLHNNPETCVFFLSLSDMLRPYVRRYGGEKKADHFGIDSTTECRTRLNDYSGSDEKSKAIRGMLSVCFLGARLEKGNFPRAQLKEYVAAWANVQISPPPELESNGLLKLQYERARELLEEQIDHYQNKKELASSLLKHVAGIDFAVELVEDETGSFSTTVGENVWRVDPIHARVYFNDEPLAGLPEWVTKKVDLAQLTGSDTFTITSKSPTQYKVVTSTGETYLFFQSFERDFFGETKVKLCVHWLHEDRWYQLLMDEDKERTVQKHFLSANRDWWYEVGSSVTRGLLTQRGRPSERLFFKKDVGVSSIRKNTEKPGLFFLMKTEPLPVGLSALSHFDSPENILVWRNYSIELPKYGMEFLKKNGKWVLGDDPEWHIAKDQKAPIPSLRHTNQFLVIENEAGQKQVLVPRAFAKEARGYLKREHEMVFPEPRQCYRFSIVESKKQLKEGAIDKVGLSYHLKSDDPEANRVLAYVYCLAREYDQAAWHLNRLRAGSVQIRDENEKKEVEETLLKILEVIEKDSTVKSSAIALHVIALSKEMGIRVPVPINQLVEDYRTRQRHLGECALSPSRAHLFPSLNRNDEGIKRKIAKSPMPRPDPTKWTTHIGKKISNEDVRSEVNRKKRVRESDVFIGDGSFSSLLMDHRHHFHQLCKKALEAEGEERLFLQFQIASMASIHKLEFQGICADIITALAFVERKEIPEKITEIFNKPGDFEQDLTVLAEWISTVQLPRVPSLPFREDPSSLMIQEVESSPIALQGKIEQATSREIRKPKRVGYNEKELRTLDPLSESLQQLKLSSEEIRVSKDVPKALVDGFSTVECGRVERMEMERQMETVEAFYRMRSENPPLIYKLPDQEGLRNKSEYCREKIAQYSDEIDQYERQMHELVNKLPREESKRLLVLTQFAGKEKERCTTHQLLAMWQHDDVAVYQKYNPELTTQECREINTIINNFLLLSRRKQHLKRCLNELNSIQDTDDVGTKERHVQQLGALENEVDYITPDDRLGAIFAYYSGFMLRPQQYKTLCQLARVDGKGEMSNLIAELTMGSGKTAVILPLLARMTSDGKKIPLLIIPQTLIEEQREYLRCINGSYFGQQIEPIDIPLGKKLTIEELDALQDTLDRIREERGYGILTDRSAHNLLVQYKNARQQWLSLTPLQAENNPQIGEVYKRLKKIRLQLKEDGHAIIDEADSVLKTRQETHLSYGNEEPLPQDQCDLLTDFFIKASKDPELVKVLNLEGGSEAPFDEIAYNNAKPKIASLLLDQLGWKPQNRERVMRYLLNDSEIINVNEAVEEAYSEEVEDCLCLIRKTVETFLSSVARQRANQRFGLMQETKGNAYCIPCVRGIPQEGREFATREEAALFTLMYYSREGVSRQQFLDMVEAMRKQGREERAASGNTVSLVQTKASKRFAKLGLHEGENLYSMQHRELIKLWKRCNASQKNRIDYARRFALVSLKAFDRKHSSNGQLLVDCLFYNVRGFTGTLQGAKQLSRKLNVIPDKEANGRLITLLYELEATVKRVDTAQTNRDELLMTLIDQMRQYDLFIDVAGLLRKFTSAEVARKLSENLPKGKQAAVTVWDEDQPPGLRGRLVAIKPGHQPVLLSSTSLTGNQVIGVLEEADTVGVDYKWGKSGLCSVGAVQTLRDTKQGVGRLRQFAKGQRVDFLVPESLGEVKTLSDVLHLVTKNQASQLARDNLQATKQKIHACIEKYTDDLLLKVSDDEARELYQSIQEAMEPTIPLRPSEVYPSTEILKDVKDVLDKVVSRALNPFRGKLTEQSLTSLENELNEICNREIEFLEEEVLDDPTDGVGQIQEVETQQEVETEAELEAEVEEESISAILAIAGISLEKPVINDCNIGKDALYTHDCYKTEAFRDTKNVSEVLGLAAEKFRFKPEDQLEKIFDSSLKQLPDHYLQGSNLLQLSNLSTVAYPFLPYGKELKRFIFRQDIKTGRVELLAATPNHENALLRLFKKEREGEVIQTENRQYRVGLFDLYSGLLAQSPIGDGFGDLSKHQQLNALRIQAKFYNGDYSNYNKEEREYLKEWIEKNGVKKMERLFRNYILRSHPKEHLAEYTDSVLHRIFDQIKTRV